MWNDPFLAEPRVKRFENLGHRLLNCAARNSERTTHCSTSEEESCPLAMLPTGRGGVEKRPFCFTFRRNRTNYSTPIVDPGSQRTAAEHSGETEYVFSIGQTIPSDEFKSRDCTGCRDSWPVHRCEVVVVGPRTTPRQFFGREILDKNNLIVGLRKSESSRLAG